MWKKNHSSWTEVPFLHRKNAIFVPIRVRSPSDEHHRTPGSRTSTDTQQHTPACPDLRVSQQLILSIGTPILPVQWYILKLPGAFLPAQMPPERRCRICPGVSRAFVHSPPGVMPPDAGNSSTILSPQEAMQASWVMTEYLWAGGPSYGNYHV
jgi:hypothetical protein